MKMFFQPVVQNKRGFSVIELLLTGALLLLVVGIVLPSVIKFQQRIEQLQGQNIAYLLSSDLRRLQTLNMYIGRNYYRVSIDEGKNQYHFIRNLKMLEKQNIQQLLNENWTLRAINKEIIFYRGGAVNSYNYLNIKTAERGYQVQVLPISGRIGVYKQ